MEETWKSVVGYEGLYEVSNLGNVRSVDRTLNCKDGKIKHRKGHLLSPKTDEGYFRVSLSKDGVKKLYKVHRLVAMAFIPNPDNLPVVNHKDEDKKNNKVENLEWCTVQYNSTYGSSVEKNLKTRVEKGHINPKYIGLKIKDYYRLKRREYRQRKRESVI